MKLENTNEQSGTTCDRETLSCTNDTIPRYIRNENYDKEFEISKEKEITNKVLDILETKDELKKSEIKIFSKWSMFKHKLNNKIRKITKSNRTIRVMLKADYTIYPIDLPINGKTVSFNGRRYKLDGYEHRLYEIQDVQCIFVDVNDARPLDLSHKYTNPSYDAREFGSLFDSKAIQDLMAGIESENKLDKMYYIGIITLAVSGLSVAILMGWIKPDWQKMIEGIVNVAQSAAIAIQTPGTGSQTITGR